jgi:hypothetical protein
MIKPLASAYSTRLTAHPHATQGLVPIKNYKFYGLFKHAWDISFKRETTLTSFMHKVLRRYRPQWPSIRLPT